MKKQFLLLLAVGLAIVLVLSGCSSGTATPSTTPAPVQTTSAPPTTTSVPATTATTQAPAPSPSTTPTTAPAQVFKLKYSDQNPQQGWQVVHAVQPWLDQVTAATHGQVQFETYYSQSLNKGPDTWNAVKNGVADVGWMFPGYWAGLMPLGDVMSLPLLPFTSAKQSSGIFWQLYEKYPALASEYTDNHVLVAWTATPFFLITTKKQVKVPADINGLKIRVSSGPPTDMMKALGAVPMMVSMPDTYLDLQKGVMDGMGVSWSALLGFKQYEVVKYYTYMPMWTPYFLIAMNNQKWNSLPKNIQDEINSVGGLKGALFLGSNWGDGSDAVGRPDVKKQGYPMVEYTPSADELAQWTAVAGKPVWDEWIKKMNSEGHTQAQDIFNTLTDLMKTYQP